MRCLPAGILKQEVLEPAPLLPSLFENTWNTNHQKPSGCQKHLNTSTMVAWITKNITITWTNTRFTKSKWSRRWQEVVLLQKKSHQKKYSTMRKVLLPPSTDFSMYTSLATRPPQQWRLLRLIKNSRCLNLSIQFIVNLPPPPTWCTQIYIKKSTTYNCTLVMPTKLYSLLLPRNQQT